MSRKQWMAACLLALAGAGGANAALVVSTTRVIVEERDGQSTVQISNKGADALLAQMWVDADARSDSASDEAGKLPFDVVPPVVRLDPGKEQTLRIVRTGQGLPKDRESVFLFNALEIPPVGENLGRNFVQVALNTRLKLFYRPENLPLTPTQSYERLQFRVENSEDAKEPVVRVNNPSPYYMTLGSLQVRRAKSNDDEPALANLIRAQERMVAPWSNAVMRLDWKSPAVLTKDLQITFGVFNDHGGESRGERKDVVQPAP